MMKKTKNDAKQNSVKTIAQTKMSG